MQLGGGKAVYGDLTSTSQLPSAQNIFMMEQKKKVLPLRLMCSGPHKVFRFRIRFFFHCYLFIHHIVTITVAWKQGSSFTS